MHVVTFSRSGRCNLYNSEYGPAQRPQCQMNSSSLMCRSPEVIWQKAVISNVLGLSLREVQNIAHDHMILVCYV